MQVRRAVFKCQSFLADISVDGGALTGCLQDETWCLSFDCHSSEISQNHRFSMQFLKGWEDLKRSSWI
jgi:hypothetical protein